MISFIKIFCICLIVNQVLCSVIPDLLDYEEADAEAETLSRERRTINMNSTSDLLANLGRILQGTASLLKTVAETKQDIIAPILDVAIETKKSLLSSPIVKTVIETKVGLVQNLPNIITPLTGTLTEILKMSICNMLCPLIGTEQCKIDHCPPSEVEDVTVSPRGLDISEAADNVV